MFFKYFVFIDSLRAMIFILVQALIAITNTILMKRLDKFPFPKTHPRVSILVPARNEERTIQACINSLVNQNYDNFEVIVLNDDSSDQTPVILSKIKSQKLRVINGKPLPQNWIGKSWACYQLSELASGDLLLFSDADTIFHPQTIICAVSTMQKEQADLITVVNHNQVLTLGEKITVPFIVWSVFTILPLIIAYLLPHAKSFCAANGKFLLFRKDFYKKIGGHFRVQNNAIEDIALAQLTKANNGKWRLFDASRLVSSRMYHNFYEAQEGFTKNYFALFGNRILVALFVWIWIGAITYHPLVTIIIALVQHNFSANFYYSIIAVITTCFLWILMSLKFKFSIGQFIFYPLTIALSIYIGIRSMILTMTNKTTWKGRQIKSARVRWL